jgi:uncharacterized membrane protein YgcG
MSARSARSLAMILALGGLAGCGLTNPNIKEVWDADYPGDPKTQTPPVSGAAQIEFEIKKRIYCELKDAVYAASHFPVTESETLGGKRTVQYQSLIPPGWIAQVVLSLQVDESVSLNPGLSLNEVMRNSVRAFGVGNTVTTPQSFSLGFGATLSSTATRIDKFNPQYSIAFLAKPETKDVVCKRENDPFTRIGWTTPSSSPFLIESDLGIKDWLLGAMVVNDLLPSDTASPPPAPAGGRAGSSGGGAAPKPGGASTSGAGGGSTGGGGAPKADTVSYEIKFVIVSNGNVTPTWKLVRFSANTGSSSFFGVGRTRTHDLIITIGPNTTVTNNANLASQISAGVSSANRALFTGN